MTKLKSATQRASTVLKKAKKVVKPDQPLTKRQKLRRRTVYLVIVVFLLIAFFSYLTNPFVRFSIIADPFRRIELIDGQFELEHDSSLLLRDDAFFRRFALVKSGYHIVGNRLSWNRPRSATTIDEIIKEIHELRFNPNEPYLISGDHFSVLYPRSLGIFYNTLLDSRTALDQTDWQNRQLIYLKTLAYALQVYNQSDRLTTTIVPVGPRSVALVNYYAPPSDTLYSLLYAISQLRDPYQIEQLYPFEQRNQSSYTAETAVQAEQLLQYYRPMLIQQLDEYRKNVYDEEEGLVKKTAILSGTKDIARRQSAFYDNVIFWRTMQLGQELGLLSYDEVFLEELKQRIIATYWLNDMGYFLEERSNEAINGKYYSSDWLIVTATGFLDPTNPDELPYFQRSVEYIQRNAIDQPFGLQYHPNERKHQLYPIVRLFAPSYGSSAIWSHWGMEYIKVLIRLAEVTGDNIYLQNADQQLSSYAFNIKRYRGFPEVYDKQGDIFSGFFYKSVLQTGWVVNYEQARAMYEWVRGK